MAIGSRRLAGNKTCRKQEFPETSSLRDLSVHPEPATGHRAIWLQSFERNSSFFAVGHPVDVSRRRRRSISLRTAVPFAPRAARKARRFNRLAGDVDRRLRCTMSFRYPRTGFSLAICATVARNSSALNEGNEQMRLLQANAAGSPRSGYSTSGFGSLPSRRSSHSRRL